MKARKRPIRAFTVLMWCLRGVRFEPRQVQTGTYLGADDIIRYDDIYARRQGATG